MPPSRYLNSKDDRNYKIAFYIGWTIGLIFAILVIIYLILGIIWLGPRVFTF